MGKSNENVSQQYRVHFQRTFFPREVRVSGFPPRLRTYSVLPYLPSPPGSHFNKNVDVWDKKSNGTIKKNLDITIVRGPYRNRNKKKR